MIKKNKENISYKLANIKDKKNILEFLRKNFNKDHFFVRNKKFFSWQHTKNDKVTFGLAKIRNYFTCIQGFVPQSHYDEKLSTKEICMTIASGTKSAPPGSLLRLFLFIKNQIKAKIIITSGFVPRTKLYNEKLGFKTNLMDHFFFIIHKKKYNIIKIKKKIIQRIKIKNGKFLELKKKDFLDNSFEKIYQYSLPKKSNNFIINRYLDHPIFKYKVYKVFDEHNICIVIIRIINIKKNCLIKIVDFIGKDIDIIKIGSLIKHLEKKYSPEIIDICSYGIDTKYFKSLGLLDRRKFKGLVIPDHTSPLEKMNVDLLIGYIATKKDEKYIRIMRGDGDRDRPS